MKFRLEWLSLYLPGEPPDPVALGKRLTAAGFIVEGIEGEGTASVLDVEVTPNRPDAMNHRGLALEAALALGRPFAEPATTELVESGPAAESLASVTIEEPALCSRYSARVLEGVSVGPAPVRVRERLLALGLGVISGPVDATNHVLWDIGQPLHAFDLDTLAKGEDGRPAILVRRAKPGEKLVTLDGVERTLSGDDLVIADAQRAVGLAGVMGGLETAITEKTTRILLEAAHFDPRSVRRTSRAVGLHTDASHRFERGADPSATVAGLDRAARLIAADGGRSVSVARGVIDAVARPTQPRTLRLRFPRVAAFLGMDVPKARCLEILRALDLAPNETSEGLIDVTVPTARVDLTEEVDLLEEIIRSVGYDALPETLPPPVVPTVVNSLLVREERVRDVLAGAGFMEVTTYSFVSKEENAPFFSLAPGDPALIANPLGEPFEVLRATPVIGLLRSARHNVNRGLHDLALFEVGRAFGRQVGRPMESHRVSLLLLGARRRHFSEPPRTADFFDGAGAVATIFAGLGLGPPALAPETVSFLAPGRAAAVSTAEGRRAGWVGVLSSALCAAWDLAEPVLAELDLAALPEPEPVHSVEHPPRFPGSEVDLTVTHALSVPFQKLVYAVRSGAPPELLAVGAVSRYHGEGVPEGSMKTTLNLRFGSPERSLSREEINAWKDAAAGRLLAMGASKVDGY